MTCAAELKNSTPFIQLIQKEIQQKGGSLSFSDFMTLALYHKEYGFYTKNAPKFGKSGDFLTAPEISPLFAQCIAKQCATIFAEIPTPEFLEIGAGSGVFARDFLLALEKLNALPQRYVIYEISEILRIQQQNLLKKACPHLYDRITWLNEFPTDKMRGIIFANEVMDALPFDCFAIENNQIVERSVGVENNEFVWKNTTIASLLENHLQRIKNECELPNHYMSEININLSAWIQSLANNLEQGVILLLDYGYGRQEYYHPERTEGTLTCFHQHQKNTNPFINIGSQDITAHVDFTHVVESAIEVGLEFKGFTTQGAFLLDLGLLDLTADTLAEIERFEQNQAIKTLTLPSEMGETIKVMALGKNYRSPLTMAGFSLLDRSRDL